MRGSGLYFDAEAREMKQRDREMIPRGLLMAMGALAIGALALATYASVTDRPLSGVPEQAAVVDSRTFTLEVEGTHVTATAPEGQVLLDTEQGAFISVVGDGLRRARTVNRTEGNPPVTLSRLENGRIVLTDPATGWRAELTSFGAGNARYFDQFFD